jgi:hypothetical protein
MKKRWALSLAVAIALAFAALSACAPKGPKAVAAETTFNFGQLDEYEIATHVFIIKNQGDQPLEIKRVKTNCACTAAKAKSKIVEPGQQTVIEVQFDAGERAGEQKRPITVETNDAATPVIQLYMVGAVIERLGRVPHSIHLLDAVPNKPLSGAMTVTNKTPQAMTITALKADDPAIIKSVLQVNGKPAPLPYKLDPGQSVVLSVTAKMPADEDIHRTSVQVITAERPDKPMRVSVVLYKKGLARAHPGQLRPADSIHRVSPGGPMRVFDSISPGIKPRPTKKPATPAGDQ